MVYMRESVSSVQFSCSVMSDSLRSHGLQHTRPPSPSPTPGVYSKLMSIESVMPSKHLILSSPSPPVFNLSQNQGLFKWVIICFRWPKYWNFSFSIILPMNIQDWFLLGWTGWISLQSKGLSRVLSNTTVHGHEFFNGQLSLHSNSHIHTWLLQKPWLDGPLLAK